MRDLLTNSKEMTVYERNEYEVNARFLQFITGMFLFFAVYFAITYFQERSYSAFSLKGGIATAAFSFISVLMGFVAAIKSGLTDKRLKYILFFLSEISILAFACAYGFNYTAIMFAIPVLISNRYSSKKYNILVTVTSVITVIAAPILALWVGQLLKYVFFDHNTLNFYPGTVITVGDSFYYSVIENFDKIDWRYTYIDTIKETSISCLFMMSLFLFANMHSIKIHRKDLVEKEQLINSEAQKKRDLFLAKSVQESVLPGGDSPVPANMEMKGIMLPSEYVSGDFYDYFPVGEDKFCMMIGDVSDHGLPAAMFMMSVRNTLRTLCEILTSPGEIVRRTNKIMCERNEENMFATLWIGVVSLKTGEMTFVNAGHPCPIVKKAGSNEIKIVETAADVPVGLFDDTSYEEHSLTLEPGDTLILYTDGITEARNSTDEIYGDANFENSVRNAAENLEDLAECLERDLTAYTGSDSFKDDVTLLLGSYKLL